MLDGHLATLLDDLFSIPVLIVLIAVGVPVIGHYWVALRKHDADNELKRSMVERGMSAEEIERVIAAKSSGEEEDE